jgi:hypothetical protein
MKDCELQRASKRLEKIASKTAVAYKDLHTLLGGSDNLKAVKAVS